MPSYFTIEGSLSGNFVSVPKFVLQPQRQLSQDGSLDLESRYGCTQPQGYEDDDRDVDPCSVRYRLDTSYSDTVIIGGVRLGQMIHIPTGPTLRSWSC